MKTFSLSRTYLHVSICQVLCSLFPLFSEMINGIATSIQFDDVLEELQQLFAKTGENNEMSHTVKDTLSNYG